MNTRLFLLFFFIWTTPLVSSAQFFDDFSDGDFTNNPTWSGDDINFEVDASQRLHLNAPAVSDVAYLSSFSDTIDNAFWEIYVEMGFNPSSSNYAEIHLVSDNSILTTVHNGYFVRLGGSTDEVSLYRQDGATVTEIIDGVDGRLSSSNVTCRIKVTRDASGNWTLMSDTLGGTNYFTEGTVLDNTYTTSQYFGVLCNYTSSRSTLFWFDDVYVSQYPVDNTPPSLDSVKVISSNELDVYFSEPVTTVSAQNVNNYFIDNGVGNPASALVDGMLQNLVHLTVSSAFMNGTTYNITVSNIDDIAGNTLSTATTSFIYLIPDTALYKDVVINEIFPDPSPQIGLPAAEFVELFNPTAKTFNLKDWQFVNTTTAKNLPDFILYPDSFIILCSINDTALFSPYGKVIGISSWPALTNSGDSLTLMNDLGNIVDVVAYDLSYYHDATKDGGGWSMELINPYTTCSDVNNWAASVDASGGTPGAVNSVFDNTPDTQSPQITSFSLITPDSLLIYFSETMDSTSLATGNYQINNGISIASVYAWASGNNSVAITLAPAIDTGVVYTLTITGVTDCPGNAITNNNTISIIIGYQPQQGEVIINEIMADPTPVVGWPDAEYVELLNLTGKIIDLSNCQFDGAAFPPNTFIQPNQYLVICDDADTALFSALNVYPVGIPSWPSLTNGGERIDLTYNNSLIIDEVTYDISWYHDNTKDDGGWSLEKINPFNPCNNGANWTASVSPNGGTPGSQNSVYDPTPDITPPQIVSVSITGTNYIDVIFSEPVDTTSLASASITIDNGINVFQVTVPDPSDLTKIQIAVTPSLVFDLLYTLSISGVTDCQGNAGNTSTTFILGYTPLYHEVVINEILADPDPVVGLPAAEFIEIFNTTNKTLDIGQLQFDGEDIPPTILYANEYAILCADEDTALFSGMGKVIGLTYWPSLTNSGEYINLTDKYGNIIDEVTYDISWYRDEEKDNGGWTLERINPYAECNYSSNWAASIDPSGGTINKQNSVYSTAPDVTAPYLTKIITMSDTAVQLFFNEEMDLATLANGIYSVDNNIVVNNVWIDSTTLKSVIVNFVNTLNNGIVYHITVTNVSDCPGNEIGIPNTMRFVLPDSPDTNNIIINEVLFNPRTGGSDFVELYNNSNKYIDLSAWQISNYDKDLDTIDNVKPITEEQYILYPGEYVLLTKDTANIKKEYPLSNTKAFLQMSSFPSYNDDEGTVIVLSPDNAIHDRFDYNKDMHFPLLNDVEGVSLERIDFNRPTNDPTNWHSAAEQVGFATPGYQNSQYQPAGTTEGELTITPEVFSPDNDGFNDVLNISYKLDAPGYVGNMRVYDPKGRLIRTLMANEYLAPEGTISWDGTNNNNEKAKVGIYIIVFEAFSTDGKTIKIKDKCVLATRL